MEQIGDPNHAWHKNWKMPCNDLGQCMRCTGFSYHHGMMLALFPCVQNPVGKTLLLAFRYKNVPSLGKEKFECSSWTDNVVGVPMAWSEKWWLSAGIGSVSKRHFMRFGRADIKEAQATRLTKLQTRVLLFMQGHVFLGHVGSICKLSRGVQNAVRRTVRCCLNRGYFWGHLVF